MGNGQNSAAVRVSSASAAARTRAMAGRISSLHRAEWAAASFADAAAAVVQESAPFSFFRAEASRYRSAWREPSGSSHSTAKIALRAESDSDRKRMYESAAGKISRRAMSAMVFPSMVMTLQ